MKLVTFGEGAGRVGVLEGEEIAVLDVPTMREYFERGGADETGERVALADTRLRAPIIPKKFFHTAGNFREHKTESENVNWAHDIAPWINFFQNVDAIIGPDEPVIYPEHLTEELDYELELAVVLKKAGKWFSAEEAMDYIGGYVIFNDLTARDIQRGEMRSGVFSFCKAIDTFCPLGPWIVTPDEIPDPRDLEMELRVNGEVRQDSNMAEHVRHDRARSSPTSRGSATRPATCSRPGRSRAWPASSRRRSGRCSISSRATSSRPRSSTSASCGTRSSRGRRATARRRCPACGPGVRTPEQADGATVSWPRDDAKLDRVRSLMRDRGLDALVVRAPDNVLYLTNFWGMKGYDAVVFPVEGEPALICLEPSREDAERTAWTSDLRLFGGYDERDPRPPSLRALDLAAALAEQYEAVGIELSLGTQATDRMVGEPTTFPKAWFDAFPGAQDATPLLNEARMLKTPQEIERMRLANDIAAAAMEHVQGVIRPGMTEAQAASEWLGFVHGEGTGWGGQVELALGFSLVWSGAGIRTFTATANRPIVEGEPTLFEIWVCADGYWCDHTKNLVPGDLSDRYRELESGLMGVYDEAVRSCVPGASLPELDRSIRAGIEAIGFPGQPSHPICHGVGARAHEPPYAHQAGGGTIEEGMILAIEPGCYWEGGGGLRVEDNFLITGDGAEKLSSFPDGIVQA